HRRRRPPAPARPRCNDDLRLASAAREAAGVPAADGLEHALGLVDGQRLQLRPRLLTHRGADARGDRADARGGTAADLDHNANSTGTDVTGYLTQGPGFSA